MYKEKNPKLYWYASISARPFRVEPSENLTEPLCEWAMFVNEALCEWRSVTVGLTASVARVTRPFSI